MGRAGVLGAVVAAIVLGSAGAVSATSGTPHVAHPPVSADLGGRPIKPDLIPTFYCHDLAYPIIHCFRTPAGLEAAIAGSGAVPGPAPAAAAVSTAPYVTIYDSPNWSGTYMHLSESYDALFTIGWNDRVSSYIARNSASGTFWTDWFASGTGKTFCCNVAVSSLPAGLDNAFSSVYRH
jgi:hypothetical protein